MTWLFTLLSVAGAACNAGGSRRGLVVGYRIWVVANAMWVGSFAWRCLWAEAALFAVYFALAIYGLKRWGLVVAPSLTKRCLCGWSGDLTEMADHDGHFIDGEWVYSARCPRCGVEMIT